MSQFFSSLLPDSQSLDSFDFIKVELICFFYMQFPISIASVIVIAFVWIRFQGIECERKSQLVSYSRTGKHLIRKGKGNT